MRRRNRAHIGNRLAIAHGYGINIYIDSIFSNDDKLLQSVTAK